MLINKPECQNINAKNKDMAEKTQKTGTKPLVGQNNKHTIAQTAARKRHGETVGLTKVTKHKTDEYNPDTSRQQPVTRQRPRQEITKIPMET